MDEAKFPWLKQYYITMISVALTAEKVAALEQATARSLTLTSHSLNVIANINAQVTTAKKVSLGFWQRVVNFTRKWFLGISPVQEIQKLEEKIAKPLIVAPTPEDFENHATEARRLQFKLVMEAVRDLGFPAASEALEEALKILKPQRINEETPSVDSTHH